MACYWRSQTIWVPASHAIWANLRKKNSESKPRGLYFSKALFGGLFLEGLMYRGKFAFQSQWASLTLGRKFKVFLCFTLYLRAISRGGGGQLNGRFFALQVWGAYFQNFMVLSAYGLMDYFVPGGGGSGQKSVVYQNFTSSPQNNWYEKYNMKTVPSLAITIFKMHPSLPPLQPLLDQVSSSFLGHWSHKL